VDAHPEECQVLAHGGTRYRQGVGHGRDGRAFPSLASDRWRADTAAALQRVIRHLQEADYGAHLFGYMITGLMSEEWYHWSIHTNELGDYGPHATRAFRQWLRAKYRTVDKLRRVWNEPDADFESIVVPTQAARQAGRNQRTFRDPATEMPVIDWYLFYNDLVPDTMERFLRAAKEASGFRKVVGAFYCYMFEFGGDPEFGHNALTRLLRSKHLDFAVVTASYFDRAPGRGADYARAPITSLGLHGKLWYHDNDTVSFRYDAMNRANPDRATVARYRRELGVTENARETIWQYRRGAGFVLGNGIYQGFFDLHGGYFDDPALMTEIGRLNRALSDSSQHDCSSVAEILVVSDEPSCAYATFESGFLQQTLQPAQVQFAKIGAPHDSILVDDLRLAELSRYRLVIFLNCFHLTASQRDLIRRGVLNRNRIVVWCYAPGLFDGPSASVEAMRALTGMRLVTSLDGQRVRLRIALTEAGRRIADTPAPAPVIGHEHVWAQVIAVRDEHALPLGILEQGEQVVLARKAIRGWTSVFTANPVLPASFLRALAREAGVHLYNNRDDTLYASRGYLCLSADGPGERTLRFPQPVDLFDPLAQELVARRVQSLTRTLADKETLLLRYAGPHSG
jgi:hypothetical protein